MRCFRARKEAEDLLKVREDYETNTRYFLKSEIYETLKPVKLELARDGPRLYKYSTRARYEGVWRGGFRDGKGTMTWRDGASYYGDWSLGYAHGQGKFIDKVGNLYEGSFFMSMAHGENGVFINTLGETYEGEWRFDKKHGKGKETWPKDNS